MSTIFGVLSLGNQKVDPSWGEGMLRANDLWPSDRSKTMEGGTWIFGCSHQFNTPQAPLAEQPYFFSNDKVILVYDGRLDNREQLAAALGMSGNDDVTDEYLILSAYSKFGHEIGLHLLGDFALAIIDLNANGLFLIRDQMGVRPLFIVKTDDFFAFSSTKRALLTLPFFDKTINKTWIADLLESCKAEVEPTLYTGIKAFPAAHNQFISPKVCERNQYWSLKINDNAPRQSETEYVTAFRSLLEQSVACRLRSYTPVGSELSGGLDSTTVTSIAAELLEPKGENIHAYSHVMAPEDLGRVFPFSDETPQMAEVCKLHPQIIHNKIESRGKGIFEDLQRSIHVHSGPVRSDLTLFGDEMLSDIKAKNIRVLLSGFGGDQLVSSKGSGVQDEYIKDKNWYALYLELHHIYRNKPLALLAFIKKLTPRLSRTFDTIRGRTKPFVSKIITYELACQTGYPLRGQANPTRHRVGTVKEQELDAILSPHVVFRLEDSALGASSYCVDYRYPLLDIRLLQFCLDLPTNMKVKNGINRRMIRLATTGTLPEMVRTRNDKSKSTVPTVHKRLIHDKKILLAHLNESQIASQLGTYIDVTSLKDRIIKIAPENISDSDVTLGTILRSILLNIWLSDGLKKVK